MLSSFSSGVAELHRAHPTARPSGETEHGRTPRSQFAPALLTASGSCVFIPKEPTTPKPKICSHSQKTVEISGKINITIDSPRELTK